MWRSALTKKRTTKALYTTGEINQMIDSLLHPLAKKDPRILIADGFIHALVENDPHSSLGKFLMYNMPTLLSHVMNDGKHSRNEIRLAIREVMKLTRRLGRKAKKLKKTDLKERLA